VRYHGLKTVAFGVDSHATTLSVPDIPNARPLVVWDIVDFSDFGPIELRVPAFKAVSASLTGIFLQNI
jgi:hypothetical protein